MFEMQTVFARPRTGILPVILPILHFGIVTCLIGAPSRAEKWGKLSTFLVLSYILQKVEEKCNVDILKALGRGKRLVTQSLFTISVARC